MIDKRYLNQRPKLSCRTSKCWYAHIEASGYDFIHSKVFCAQWKCRSDIYQYLHIVCLRNTLQHVGWGVCKHVFIGGCMIAEGT